MFKLAPAYLLSLNYITLTHIIISNMTNFRPDQGSREDRKASNVNVPLLALSIEPHPAHTVKGFCSHFSFIQSYLHTFQLSKSRIHTNALYLLSTSLPCMPYAALYPTFIKLALPIQHSLFHLLIIIISLEGISSIYNTDNIFIAPSVLINVL